MIKPDFWSDEKTGQLSDRAKLLFIGMWNFADDEGRIRYHALYLRSCVFPYSDITHEEIKNYMNELEAIGLVIPYQINGQVYAEIKNFKKHQVIDRPQQSKIPPPGESSQINTEQKNEQSANGRRIVGEQSEIKEKLKEVKEKLKEREVKEKEYVREKFPDFHTILISESEYLALVQKFGEVKTKEKIEALHLYIGSKGKKYKSHYLTILNWERMNGKAESGTTRSKIGGATANHSQYAGIGKSINDI